MTRFVRRLWEAAVSKPTAEEYSVMLALLVIVCLTLISAMGS
jgi:hypothetical protein